jgi:hypothetical protein
MAHRFSLYYMGPKDTVGINPDWTLKNNCGGIWHLTGYLLTERPVEQKDLQIPRSQMSRIESEYHGEFIEFNRKRPRSCRREDQPYDPQMIFDFMDC